ncbi:hypothetical protein C8R46DRAFT_1060910 [Mycena filopes]|nr:hypothetical protein C8R46DRAFT_1060910 [Mycena filopes]
MPTLRWLLATIRRLLLGNTLVRASLRGLISADLYLREFRARVAASILEHWPQCFSIVPGTHHPSDHSRVLLSSQPVRSASPHGIIDRPAATRDHPLRAAPPCATPLPELRRWWLFAFVEQQCGRFSSSWSCHRVAEPVAALIGNRRHCLALNFAAFE